MKAVIFGASGQLGRVLGRAAPEGTCVTELGRSQLDLRESEQVEAYLLSERPHLIFNASAYTQVDRAESDEKNAYDINTVAVACLARIAERIKARLVHISTDFVFDGSQRRPYRPSDPARPLSVYGRTKLGGERAAGPSALLVRTSWLYAASGHNFVNTMLRLMREGAELRVVSDQVGAPTWAPGLAKALWFLAARGLCGLYHYSDGGVASWYDFAIAIQEEALALQLVDHPVPIVPISYKDYPAAAPRPRYSLMNSCNTYLALGYSPTHWRVNLRRMLQELRADG